MTKLPVVSGIDAVKAFGRVGYRLDHQTGSHMILRQDGPPHRRLTVPGTTSLRAEPCARSSEKPG